MSFIRIQHHFIVIKNTDLTEKTIGAVERYKIGLSNVNVNYSNVRMFCRHVSMLPLSNNHTWHGAIPVENETRKKKEYLNVSDANYCCIFDSFCMNLIFMSRIEYTTRNTFILG